MQSVTNQTIYDLIDRIAPYESQEAFDNAGFNLGDPKAPLSGLLVALDVTPEVIRAAEALKAGLIVCHHPLMFNAIQSLREDAQEGRLLGTLIRNGLSVISAHTNLDQSELGAARLIAEELGLANIRKADPYVVLGDLPDADNAESLGERLSRLLGLPVRAFGNAGITIRTLAIAGGAYSDGWLVARQVGAQALLTAEVRHHHALAARSEGFLIYDGGHEATELPMMAALARYLQKELDDLEYSVSVHVSGLRFGPKTWMPKEER